MNNKIDREFLEKLNNLDEKTLRMAVMSLAEAAGVNPKKAEYATNNIKNIKKQISKMTEKDVENLISHTDKKKADEIIDFIKKSGD